MLHLQYSNAECLFCILFNFQGKLVKLFSKQLVAKQKCNEDLNHCQKLREYPKLEQWLQVVGINEEAIKVKTIIIDNNVHCYYTISKQEKCLLMWFVFT